MIRLARNKDIDSIMEIIKEVQKEMKKEGNPQWSVENDYPNKEIFLEDLKNKELYVYEENKEIIGLIVISNHDDYLELVNNTSKEKSYVLHRLAIKKDYRNQNIASKFFEYAESLAKSYNIKVLKGDTEEHNIKMNSLFKKLGFQVKDEFEYTDYLGHYIYYEKKLDNE